MEEADQGFGSDPPALLSLTHFTPIPTPSSRWLSSNFTPPSRPVPSARRLAYVSLQGRLVNAEEASSSRAIGGCLSREEAVAWELFRPTQRFLIVAVIGVAVAESKKNSLIRQLRKNVELKDQVLSTMQQKLDDLCEQLNNVKDQPESNMSVGKNVESSFKETFGSDKIKFVDCGCWLCDQHHHLLAGLTGSPVMKASSSDEILQYKTTFTNEAEQEERRMSDLSDWSSSVTSAAEIQLINFAIEQDDFFHLKNECEEKDATIKELTFFLQSSNTTGSKKISEMEDIIRRKNKIITRLKNDMTVLEQKVVHLTRLGRASSSSATNSNCWQHPVMTDNLLYNMDGSSSSSDSDCSPVNPPQARIAKVQVVPVQNVDLASSKEQKSAPSKSSGSFAQNVDLASPKEQKSAPAKPSSSFVQNVDLASTKDQKSAPAKSSSSFVQNVDLPSPKDQKLAPAKPSSSYVQNFDLASPKDQKSAPSKSSGSFVQNVDLASPKDQKSAPSKPSSSSVQNVDFASPKDQKSAPAKSPSSFVQNVDLASPKDQKLAQANCSSSFVRPTDLHTKSQSVSPLKELALNQNPNALSSQRQRRLSASGEFKKSRRRIQKASKDAASQKRRWV